MTEEYDYWTSPDGIAQRIGLLCDTYTYKVYNGAIQVVGAKNLVYGFEWIGSTDERTCFPASTMIHTRTGLKQIKNVNVTEEVLTRKGWRHVLAKQKNPYSGHFIHFETSNQTLTCTTNHPLHVTGKGWVRACDVHVGDVLQSIANKPTPIVDRFEFAFLKPHDLPATILQVSIFSRVLLAIMPIIAINFNNDSAFTEKKIHRIPANLCFLNVIKAKFSKCLLEFRFKTRFAFKPSITHETAKPSRRRWGLPKFFATVKALFDYGWSSTILRTIFPIGFTHPEQFSTTQTTNILNMNVPTSLTAHSVPIGEASKHLKGFAADGTNLSDSDSLRVRTAFPRTIYLKIAMVVWNKLFAAISAFPFDPLDTELVETFATTKNGARPTGLKNGPTITTLLRKHLLLSDLITQWFRGFINVYNLEIEDAHEYYANGILVHNCNRCDSQIGRQFKLGQFMVELPIHQNCRCEWRPILKR